MLGSILSRYRCSFSGGSFKRQIPFKNWFVRAYDYNMYNTMKAEIYILGLLLSRSGTFSAAAAVECNATAGASCDELLNMTGSECVNGRCTNPFASGCLRRMLGDDAYGRLVPNNYPNLRRVRRVCNSDDDENAERDGLCSKQLEVLDYTEIRISPNNWASAMFNGWILQILMSELLFVPVSIETGVKKKTGGKGGSLSFYDMHNTFEYQKKNNDFEALATANEEELDCSKTTANCAHVLPELWQERVEQPEDWSTVEQDFLGMTGGDKWYIPRYTLDEHLEMASYFGLQGEENRKKLAETFKRPTTWAQYCKEMSTSQCAETDDYNLAPQKSPPTDNSTDGQKYHVKGKYRGYFRYTEKNNCTRFPDNCTGHFLDFPCGWGEKSESQLYWNNISLDNIHYTVEEMLQVFAAANETKENVITVWWFPEPTTAKYDYFPVSLPKVTNECLKNRPELSNGTRCGQTLKEKRGKREGSCGYAAQSLEMFYASELREAALKAPATTRSPAYQFLRNYRMSETEMAEILKDWDDSGRSGFGARHAVCSWIANNTNINGTKTNNSNNSNSASALNSDLMQLIPLGYPREVREDVGHKSSLQYSAWTLGAVGSAVVLVISIATWRSRKCKIMRFAQVEFLYLFCVGYALVAVGAILYGFRPNRAFCISREWAVLLGYTFGNVPLLVKTAAINKMMQGAKKMKRIRISKRSLYAFVGFAVLVTAIFLTTYTAVENPKRTGHLSIQPANASGGSRRTIDVYQQCSSSNADIWKACAFVWQGIYIVFAAFLSFQSRNVKQEFNESQNVGNMAYVSFLFLTLRIVAAFLPVGTIKPNVRQGVTSILLSMDTVMNMLVYFAPKFYLISKNQAASDRLRLSTSISPANEERKERRESVPIAVRDLVPQISFYPPRAGEMREFCRHCECPKCKPLIRSMDIGVLDMNKEEFLEEMESSEVHGHVESTITEHILACSL